MDAFFNVFSAAYAEGDGYALSGTLVPLSMSDGPDLLQPFIRSTNYSAAERDIRKQLNHRNAPLHLSKDEVDAWTDIYHAFWKALNDIQVAESANKSAAKVSELKRWLNLQDLSWLQ